MEFSNEFIRKITRPFLIDQCIVYNRTLEDNLTFDRNNIFNKSLIVDITGDDIEIPLIAKSGYEKIILINNSSVEKVILNLYVSGNGLYMRTFNGIIEKFFRQVLFNERLIKVTTSKGETYYGGCGLILDAEFNPLLMCGLKARKLVTNNSEGVKVVSLQYYKAICRVSPSVFTEPNKMINKGIIKKLIPLYTTIDVLTNFLSYNNKISSSFDSKKVEVIIDDFSRFFITPIAPTPSKCNNDVLNKCLNDNIEDILTLV